MKSADFNYHRPREVNEALTLLKEVGEEGKILAGGQSLMPMMNWAPQAARIAAIISVTKRVRFAQLPPYWSVREFERGDMN